MSLTVAVVIVNFNSGEALASTVESLEAAFTGVAWEAIVVDNSSSDGSEGAALNRTRVKLLRGPGNVGFAAAVNRGISVTPAPFVLVLNPDCRLGPLSGVRLFEELQQHSRCAIVGPRILNTDGTLQESARGDPNVLTGLFGRTTILSRLFRNSSVVRRNLVSSSVSDEVASSRCVDWVSGACMLARRNVLAGLGGFDEGYFLYWEDADLCRRLRNAGWETRYVPGATVVHDVGHSSRNAKSLANREFHRSAYRYFATHMVPQWWHPGRFVGWAILMLRWRIKALVRWMSPGRA
jgi:GT2 family glycosyltransferase